MTTPLGLLLTPGARGSADHRSLLEIEAAVAGEQIAVRRHDFAYRRQGKRGPPRADRVVEELVPELPQLAAELGVAPERMVLGGRSFGGRVCSMAVAAGAPAAGLILLSYPLHTPGKPQNLRNAHFGQIEVPCLFVSGDKDDFASTDELRAATQSIAGPVRLEFVSGRHDPKSISARGQIIELVQDWLADLSDRLAGQPSI